MAVVANIALLLTSLLAVTDALAQTGTHTFYRISCERSQSPPCRRTSEVKLLVNVANNTVDAKYTSLENGQVESLSFNGCRVTDVNNFVCEATRDPVVRTLVSSRLTGGKNYEEWTDSPAPPAPLSARYFVTPFDYLRRLLTGNWER